jgi:hypothetical protein
MRCARKNIKTETQLPYPSKALKIGGIHDAIFTSREMNITMDVIKDVFSKNLAHPIHLSEEKREPRSSSG